MFIVYLITCRVNGKVYVGQTFRPMETRFQEHLNHAQHQKTSCRKLYSAIRKYRIDNFSIEKIGEASTQEEADVLEIQFISNFDSIKLGYNLQHGGYNGRPSNETRKLMSEQHSGEHNAMFGKTHSEESKHKISDTRKKLFNEGILIAPWKGKALSQEVKDKISISRKGLTVGEKNPGAKLTSIQVEEIKLLLLENDLTRKQIADRFNVSLSTIKRIRAGKAWN